MNVRTVVERLLRPSTRAYAHCDIPCGIYHPHAAQLGAESVERMTVLMAELAKPAPDASPADWAQYSMQMRRYTTVKEQHAEIVKHEVRIIWGDYFKPPHLEMFPDLHTKVWMANKLASRNKQNVDAGAAEELLAAVREIAQIFWETKGVATRVAGSNQAVGGELVYVA